MINDDSGDYVPSDTLWRKIKDVLLFFWVMFIGTFIFVPELLKDFLPLIGRRLRGEKQKESDEQGIEVKK